MIKKRIILFILALGGAFHVKAQMSGVYNIPSTIPSLAVAISSLNSVGINGPVTINVNAGYTELAPVGGYSIYAVPGASSINAITFQKSGLGANPLISAYTGVATSTDSAQDGVWRFIGADYITIDAIDIIDVNTSNPATMEFGYGMCKASISDGCQYNTIQNCVITLNKINISYASTSGSFRGSRGIDGTSTLAGTYTTVLAPTSPSGSNSHNKFYSNTVKNCQRGIALYGYSTSSIPSTTLSDTGNDIGGNSSVLGNTIVDFVGTAIETSGQQAINISYNIIDNTGGGGSPSTGGINGISLINGTNASPAITNNTITIVTTGTNVGTSTLLQNNTAFASALNNTVNIKNNLFLNCVFPRGTCLGIYNGATCENLNIENNTFSGITSYANGTDVSLIDNNTGGLITGTININNNNFNNINFPGLTVNNGDIFFINNDASSRSCNELNINNNNFSNFNFPGIAPSSWLKYILNNLSQCPKITINNNIWNNLNVNQVGILTFISSSATNTLTTISNNSVVTGYTRSGGSTLGLVSIGGLSASNCTRVVSNNDFSNITATSAGVGSVAGFDFYGSSSNYPLYYVYNNKIINFNYPTTGNMTLMVIRYPGMGGTSSVTAIHHNTLSAISSMGSVTGFSVNSPSTTLPIEIYSNAATDFSTSCPTSSSTYTLTGMYVDTYTVDVNVYKNKIGSLTMSGSTAKCVGLHIFRGNNINIYNNIIGDIVSPSSTQTNGSNGIYIEDGATADLYYNSVHLNGNSTAAFSSSNALYTNTTTILEMKNNILINTSIPKGSGLSCVYRRIGNNLSTYSNASNFNLFYAGVPTNSNVLFSNGTSNYSTLANYKTAVNPRDVVSMTESPPFTSTVASTFNYLDVNTSIPTQVESSGVPISGITDDYAGNLRNTTTPDLGAWEGNYIAADKLSPILISDGFTSGYCSLTSRTYTANLIDSSGVATGTLSPRIYYKINSGPYTSTSGVLTSGNNKNGVWGFTLTYATSIYDIVSYFLVAQDTLSTPNVIGLPIPGFSAFDVNTISSPPSSPFTYTIGPVLSGTYSVGPSGNFSSLTSAAYAYNKACLTNSVNFVLTNSIYGSGETFPVTFSYNPTSSITNSLLIQPAPSVNAVVNGSTSNSSVIKFLNAHHITLDGQTPGGGLLTVNNNYTFAASTAIWLASGTSSIQGNKNVEIKNCTIRGTNNTYSASTGIFAGADASPWPDMSGGIDNDNISISTNTITACYGAIYCTGNSTLSSGGMDGLNINGNVVGPPSSTNIATTIGGSGIYVNNAVTPIINNNLVRGIYVWLKSYVSGINLTYLSGATVSQNTVNNISSNSGSGSGGSIAGIIVGKEAITTTVISNVIYNIVNSAGGGARGITIEPFNYSSYECIRNNMISKIEGGGDPIGWTCPYGIAIESVTGYVDVSFNTVWLFGTFGGGPTTLKSAALYSDGLDVTVKNNIFKNTIDFTSTFPERTCAVMFASSPTAIDYNDYYVGPPATSPYLADTGPGVTTLAQMQAAYGGDMNSKTIFPSFIAANDLHMAYISANLPLENLGTPVAGITTDFDNQTRNIVSPDMGADEFTIPWCTTADAGTITPSNIQVCALQNFSLASTGFSTGINSNFQWQWSPTSGGPYGSITSATNTAYSTSLAPGTYYYVLTGTCTSVSSPFAVSNEGTVTVNPLPVLNVVSSSSIICIGQTATINVSGANSYTWSTGSNSTSIIVSPTITTNYTVTGIDVNNCIDSTIVTQSVSACVSISEEFNSTDELLVYPNPFNGTIEIKSNAKINKVEIYNALGMLILNFISDENHIQLNLSEISSGIYFVKIGSKIKKLVKE